MQARLLRIAASHERLVKLAEGGARREGPPSEPDHRVPPADDLRGSRIAAEYEEASVRQRSREDPIAKERRHIAQAEDRIARQETLVAKLSADKRFGDLAAQARVILATLKETLRLAREHLALELKK
jgi:hypothetical protein